MEHFLPLLDSSPFKMFLLIRAWTSGAGGAWGTESNVVLEHYKLPLRMLGMCGWCHNIGATDDVLTTHGLCIA